MTKISVKKCPRVYFSFFIPITMGELTMLGYPVVFSKRLGFNVILTDNGKIGVRDWKDEIELFIIADVPLDIELSRAYKVFESYIKTIHEILMKLKKVKSN